jgi:penicillin-insensitive murein endopeptidase
MIDHLDEVLELVEVAERQKLADEREIEELRRALRRIQPPRRELQQPPQPQQRDPRRDQPRRDEPRRDEPRRDYRDQNQRRDEPRRPQPEPQAPAAEAPQPPPTAEGGDTPHTD